MSKKTYFITGISTDVGKTIASAIVVEALQADYWKPIQSGDLEFSDTDRVNALISNDISFFHANSYALQTPMSPHASAAIDGVNIRLENIKVPKTHNHLVIEGAGGLLVPLNDHDTIADIIPKNTVVILVSRHYLGSINHTLLSAKYLQQQGFAIKLIFSGNMHKTTEDIIKKMTGIAVIGRISEEENFDKAIIRKYAEQFREKL